MIVLDASAVLAFLQDERGSDQVEQALVEGALIGAANWAEVAQKVRARDADWAMARSLLLSFDVVIEPVTEEDAEWAAQRWQPGEGLSLADRLCLALTHRSRSLVLTADRSWKSWDDVVVIR